MTWSNSWQGSKGWGNLNSIEGTLLCCFEVGARKEEKFIETNDTEFFLWLGKLL